MPARAHPPSVEPRARRDSPPRASTGRCLPDAPSGPRAPPFFLCPRRVGASRACCCLLGHPVLNRERPAEEHLRRHRPVPVQRRRAQQDGHRRLPGGEVGPGDPGAAGRSGRARETRECPESLRVLSCGNSGYTGDGSVARGQQPGGSGVWGLPLCSPSGQRQTGSSSPCGATSPEPTGGDSAWEAAWLGVGVTWDSRVSV